MDDKKKDLYAVAQAIVKYIEQAESQAVKFPGRRTDGLRPSEWRKERNDLIENSK